MPTFSFVRNWYLIKKNARAISTITLFITVRWPGFRPWLTQPLWPQSITQPLQKKTLKL